MPLILGANSLAGGGYEIDNSLRFNDGSSDYLSRTQSTGNRKTWTYSVWIKRSQLGTNQNWGITQEDAANNNAMPCSFNTFDKIDWYDYNAPSVSGQLSTNRVFRDTSAWYHIVLAVDTTNATADDRMKMYVNGVQETSFATRVNPSLNYDFNINVNTKLCAIGAYYTSSPATFYDGYMSEINFIDGQQLAPSDFGEFDEDSGIWKPIAYTGTYGTNGFYLEFKDSSALGDDTSGNSNDFTVNNLTAIDQSTDTPTNNFATMNPLVSVNSSNFSEGNLKINLATNDDTAFSSIAVSQGKWYWEAKRSTQGGRGYDGVCSFDVPEMGGNAGRDASTDFAYTDHNGVMNVSAGATSNSNTKGSALSSGDIICYAFDADNGQLYATVNGNIDTTGTANATGLTTGKNYFYFFEDSGSGSTTVEVNFGNPSFTISSGNSDANGYGNFEHAVPSGYYALCTANLAEYG
jgi:hypothetical protein